MPRMMLTDEEARVLMEFRRKNEVRNAFNEGLEEAIRVVREAQRGLDPSSQPISDTLLSQICGSITARRR